MGAADFEPPSGWNLPPGCFEGDPRVPWNEPEPEPTACGDCPHLLEGCCDFGICELEFAEAFDRREGKGAMTAWEAAQWALDWAVDHYRDMQEDTCATRGA